MAGIDLHTHTYYSDGTLGPRDLLELAKDRGLSGPIHAPASAFCKQPPRQVPDDEAFVELERVIGGGA